MVSVSIERCRPHHAAALELAPPLVTKNTLGEIKMQEKFVPRKHVLALSIASLFSAAAAQAQTPPTAAEENSATVVVTGTRVANRTVMDTTSPVDVISAETLKTSGTTEINQALSIALPSL